MRRAKKEAVVDRFCEELFWKEVRIVGPSEEVGTLTFGVNTEG